MLIHVGTSGFNYPEWRGTFYPADIKSAQLFEFYAARFRTVEINQTFYRMPTPKTTEGWRTQAPDGFTYTLKAPQRITHVKRLKECAEDVQFFCESARVLGPYLATLLFQLPPNLKLDLARLRDFLTLLPPEIRVAFEFRHDSWHHEDVYAALAERSAALCIADFGDRTTPIQPTARFGYFRLRDEGYAPADLDRWAKTIGEHADRWDDVFVYFKHEDEGKGPEFARIFLDALAARGLMAP
jgi:uncharacterized protein YecE (DUF72 family)